MIQYGQLAAVAQIRGDEQHPDLRGKVKFFFHRDGILLAAVICGLPDSETDFFAFHIHEGDNCSGEDFSNTGSHYDPCRREHPRHAGDLPPLLSSGGRAYLAVVSNRFSLREIIGKTMVIHGGPDDFTTQPAGNAGEKIACGVIRRV